MKNKREELLAITTYEEFDERREEFENLEWDEEMSEHVFKLSPELDAIDENVGMLHTEKMFKARPLNLQQK